MFTAIVIPIDTPQDFFLLIVTSFVWSNTVILIERLIAKLITNLVDNLLLKVCQMRNCNNASIWKIGSCENVSKLCKKFTFI